MKTFWKKLQNPFALVGQGFIAGALLFWAGQSDANPAPVAPSAAPSSVLASS